jgi:hypothetical protein
LEVPNNEIAWSSNQSSGLYFKLILKVVLCSQEFYRDQLGNRTLDTAILLLVVAISGFLVLYRINTPSIFNPAVQ